MSCAHVVLVLWTLFAASACIIPLAPEFEAPEANLSPYIVSAEPRVAAEVGENEEIVVVLADPNLGDELHLRWVFNYPPFVSATSRLFEGGVLPAPLGGNPIRSRVARVQPECFRDLLPNVPYHRAMLVVSDRPFLPAVDSLHPFDHVPPDALVVRASWVVRKECQ